MGQELAAEADHGDALVASWGEHAVRVIPAWIVDVAHDDGAVIALDLDGVLRLIPVQVAEGFAVHDVVVPNVIVMHPLEVRSDRHLLFPTQSLCRTYRAGVGRERRVGTEDDPQVPKEVKRPSHLEAGTEHPLRVVAAGPPEVTWHAVMQLSLIHYCRCRLRDQ